MHTTRNVSVDTLRVVAILAVIVIHTTPYSLNGEEIGERMDAQTLINLNARFAVPIFFIFSGYFWAKKIEISKNIYVLSLQMLKRIFYIFVMWSLIYILPTNFIETLNYGIAGPLKQIYWNVQSAASQPLYTLMQGTKVHLWFLMGLMWSVSISSVFIARNKKKLLIFIAVIFYFIGLAGKAYSDSPFGFQINFNFRNGPFFSLAFFVTGYILYQERETVTKLKYGLIIALFGVVLQFFELSTLNNIWKTNIAQDYVIGTYFYGLGIAIFGLSYTPNLYMGKVATIAPMVLGIYASHYIFVDFFKPFNIYFAGYYMWTIIYIILVFSLSLKLSILMSKSNTLKKLIV